MRFPRDLRRKSLGDFIPGFRGNHAKDVRHNQKVENREAFINEMPAIFLGEAVRPVVSQAVDIAQDIPFGTLAVGGLAGVAGVGALNSIDQLRDEGRTADPLSVAARTAANGVGLLNGGRSAFGGDPLAQVRNNIRDSAEIVGSQPVMEALVADQYAQNQLAQQQVSPQAFEQEVMAVAGELQGHQEYNSDGSATYMDSSKAFTLAADIVTKDWRARGLL